MRTDRLDLGDEEDRLIPLYITFTRIHQDLFDAAEIDGYSSYRIFWYIAFPQLTPVVTAIAVFKIC